MSIVSYLRVSTKEQTVENQRIAIKEKGYKIDKEFSDHGVTGKNINRENFLLMMDYLREGDILIVYSFSRIARSTRDLLKVIDDLEKKKVQLIAITEAFDASTASGRLMLTLFSAVYQFEVETMRERQQIGIERAKKEGKFKGRQKKEIPDYFIDVYKDLKNKKISANEAFEKVGMSRATFYKNVKLVKENNDLEFIKKNGECTKIFEGVI